MFTMLLVRLSANSRLLVVKYLESHILWGFVTLQRLARVLAPSGQPQFVTFVLHLM